ncbi:helix-turn-helix domain-containing protein [uncultured Aquimarina sp.]|uniref:helix-turn-helix domain-containing protein n=1 Tax=uncultured Aquimarina sp. TaxID=575652 RepID=UPI002612ED95|nr:helix-turn-helix domain-containing protein [uncultured Aquimarina sp.]
MIFPKKRISFFILFIITLISFTIHAQDTNFIIPDSLKTKTPEQLVNLIRSSEADFIEVYEEILESFHKNDSVSAKFYLRLGFHFYRKEDFKRSIKYANRVHKIGNKLNDKNLLFWSYILNGATFLREGKHQNSFNNYYEAVSIAKKEEKPENIIIANSGLVLVLHKMNRLDKALEISKEMLQGINKTSFKNGRDHVRILTNINEVYLDKEQYDSVLYYADKGIDISKSIDFKEGLVDLYIKKGIVYYYKKDFDQAFDNLYKAKDILDNYDIGNKFFPTVKVNYYMAGCYYEEQNYDQAISYLCNTMDFIKEEDVSKLPVIQSHLLLANCYFKKKDFVQGHYWERIYINLNENYQEEKDKTVDTIYEKETEKYEKEIAKLKSKENISSYLLIGSITISLTLLLIGFTYYKKQQSNKLMFSELVDKINLLEVEKSEKDSKNNSATIVIDDDKVTAILKGLDKLEDQEYFLKTECNLRTIAKKVKTNTTYLTKIIHAHKGKNFNEYITDLRIEYALQRLKNDKIFRAFSVKSIAAEVGYKSDDAFAKRFKAKTGLNPSYYIKNIEKLQQENSITKSV